MRLGEKVRRFPKITIQKILFKELKEKCSAVKTVKPYYGR